MGKKTEISWTDATWNPVRGCSRVSAGCDNCYAMGVAHRFSNRAVQDPSGDRSLDKPAGPYHGLTTIRRGKVDWAGVARFIPEQLDAPLRWSKPRRIFVNSMSDLFHESLSNEEIAAVFGVMAACPQHTFQVLTKRPKRATEWFKWISARETDLITAAELCGLDAQNEAYSADLELGPLQPKLHGAPWPLPNVWLGVSAEDQDTYNARLPMLVHQCPAAVHFVSLEPMLGPIKLRGTGHIHLDWVIIGGESGPGARPFDLSWARSLVGECAESAIPCFVKQLGARAIDSSLRDVNGYGYVHYTGAPGDARVLEAEKRHDYRVTPHDVTRLLARDRRKGADMSEWEPALRIREFPDARA